MPIIEPTLGFDPIQLNGQDAFISSAFFDEFVYTNTGGTDFANNWNTLGAGPFDFATVQVADHPGFIAISGTAAATFNFLGQLAPLFPLQNGFWQFSAIAQVPILSGAGQTFNTRLGITNSAPAAQPSDGVYFESNQASLNWQLVCASGGARTLVDSGVVISAGAWYLLTITGADALAPVSYSINGAAAGTVSSNIPAAAIGLGFQVEKVAGAVARQLFVDMVYHGYAFTSFR